MGFRPDFSAGPANYQDGVVQSGQSFRAQRDGSLIVSESHGKYYEGLSRGLIYKATTLTAGVALILAATTGNHPTLWNPNAAGSFNAEFLQLNASRVSGTDAPGAWYWCSTIPAGSALGVPILTFTNVPPLNALVGGTPASDAVMKWAPAINTYSAYFLLSRWSHDVHGNRGRCHCGDPAFHPLRWGSGRCAPFGAFSLHPGSNFHRFVRGRAQLPGFQGIVFEGGEVEKASPLV